VTNARLTGQQKAALLILGIDEPIAQKVLKYLEPDDLKRLAAQADQLATFPIEALDTVFEDFERRMREPVLPRGAGSYVRKLTASTFGEDTARKVFTPPSATRRPLETIRQARVQTLAMLLQDEQPQLAAVIISQLPREQAAKVLGAMPANHQVDLVARIANLKEVPPQAVDMASEALAKAIDAAGGLEDDAETREFDGVAFAAGLLNELPAGETDRLLGAINEGGDEELGSRIRNAMFTFEDLSRLNQRSLQTLMREVQSETLLLALKTASEALRDHFLSAVSSRAAATMREDLANMPPARLSEVEKAQGEIVQTAMRLAGENRITLPGGGGGEKMV